MSKTGIPAQVPDPQTGEPRPPDGPVATWSPSDHRCKRSDAKLPPVPEGGGPMLEWYQESKGSPLIGSLAIFALAVVALTLVDWGFDWMGTWYIWLATIWHIPFMYLQSRITGGVSAGALWFAIGKRNHVMLYELTEIKVEGASGGMSWSLHLKDAHGGEVGISMSDVQANRKLWALVYNGIAHSAMASPAIIANRRTARMLELG